jgi:hypothetical protein
VVDVPAHAVSPGTPTQGAAKRARTTPTTRARPQSPGCVTPTCAWSPVKTTLRWAGYWPTATMTSLACALRRYVGVHAALCALTPGGLGRTLSAARAADLLRTVRAVSQVQTERKGMAQDLLSDVGRLDTQLAASKARIQVAVAASGTTVTEVYGVRGDRGRFVDRAQRRYPTVRVQGSLRHLQRDCADPGVQRTAGASSAQPGRQPPAQSCVA